MNWKFLSTSIPLLALSLQAACMTSSASAKCRVDGAQYFLVEGADADAICARFQQDFYSGLGDGAEAGTHEIALEITKDGTINARIALSENIQKGAFSEVSVDVMDRALTYRDLTQLAQAAAEVVKQDRNGA